MGIHNICQNYRYKNNHTQERVADLERRVTALEGYHG